MSNIERSWRKVYSTAFSIRRLRGGVAEKSAGNVVDVNFGHARGEPGAGAQRSEAQGSSDRAFASWVGHDHSLCNKTQELYIFGIVDNS